MIGKAVLLLVLAAVAVQSYAPSEEVEVQFSIFSHGGNLIHRLEDLVGKGIKSAKNALDKLHHELSDKVNHIIETAKTKVNKQVYDLFEKIKKLKAEAVVVKIDIKECLSDREQQMTNLLKAFPGKVVGCGKSIIDKSKALIEQEKHLVENTIGTVKNLASEIKHCGSFFKHLKCEVKVGVKIAKAIKDIPGEIQKAVSDAPRTIEHLVPDAELCVAGETEGLIAQEISISKSIETCVLGKIHAH